jgi:hypothetical protein
MIEPEESNNKNKHTDKMKNATLLTSALVALGIVSQAGAATTNVVYITGSTAFRGNVFTTLTTPGAVFDAAPTILPTGAGSGTSAIVYQGTIGGTNYSIDCDFTGSEAGIACVEGLTSLLNFSKGGTNYNLPGVPTTFLNPFTGGAGTNTTVADLTFADTSQAVSLTKPPTYPALTEYGTIGVVTFTWLKGKNSSPDSSWTDLSNITQVQLFYQLATPQLAAFFTGSANDLDTVYTVGRNHGSGTYVNMKCISGNYGIGTPVDQVSWNSGYVSGVLTYDPSGAPFFPAVTATPTDVGSDGFDSGAFVSDVLSCDQTGSGVVIVGYAGLSDAKHANAGQGTKDGSSLANQPGGAVFLTLDGVGMNDQNIIDGTYSFWGHEHLYGQPGQSSSSAAGIVAGKLVTAVPVHGGLGDGTAPFNQDTGIQYGVMNADKPGGGDTGYPSL